MCPAPMSPMVVIAINYDPPVLLRRAKRSKRPAGAGAGGRHQAARSAVLLGCALRRSDVAPLTDGRAPGGFTPEATIAARRANTPEYVGVVPATPSAFRPSARGRSRRRTTRGWRRNWPPASPAGRARSRFWGQVRQMAHPPAGAVAVNAPDITT